MPGKDGTGPMGMGPKTGRGFGPCNGYPVAPYAGYGMGAGRGRGCRWVAHPGMPRYGYIAAPGTFPPVQEQENAGLRDQVNILTDQLEQLKEQLKNFEA